MQLEYAEMMKWFRYNHPDKFDRWMDSLNPNQIKCKEWLVYDGLPKVKIPRDAQGKFRVEIIGGWYGFPLIQFLVDEWSWLQIREIDIFEIVEFACKVIWKYCELFGYKKVRIFNQ